MEIADILHTVQRHLPAGWFNINLAYPCYMMLISLGISIELTEVQ